jgi:hypothetical protein
MRMHTLNLRGQGHHSRWPARLPGVSLYLSFTHLSLRRAERSERE